MAVTRLVLLGFIIAFPLLVAAEPAAAWDRTGHQVVARIAWTQLSPEARSEAVALLAAAPADSGLSQLLPHTSRKLGMRQAEHFQLAAYWADIVRDTSQPARHEKYHHSDWHYINYFFDQRGPERTPHERSDLKPQSTNVVERLEALSTRLGDESVPEPERAIALAWILHLVGDIHQPLHATARVTELEPKGDRGGNEFRLDDDENLHSLWDGALRDSNFRWWFQREANYVRRIAMSIIEEHPPDSFADRVKNQDFEAWARESFGIARDRLYPAELRRGHQPPAWYLDMVARLARERTALAGYRLAALLESRLD